MDRKKIILEEYTEHTFLFLDGFDSCIIGVCFASIEAPRVIYSVEAVLNELTAGGLTYEEALEHFEFNIFGAHVGDQTPIFAHAQQILNLVNTLY